jgi:NAD(P)-dependent dehydrogenase (short-subunit alcohol dehydrogenase family)
MLHPSSHMPLDANRPQVVMITGASAGVGRAVARAFGHRGASLGLFARGRAGLEAAARDVAAAGGRALILKGDVADPDRVEEAAAALEQTFGPIDVWVNNAMASVFSPVIEMEPAEYKRVTDVTYLGIVHGTLSALRRMKPRNRGVIIQVGSALAYRGIPLQSAYCAAKHAMEGFCDSLRAELLHDDSAVQVTMVHLPALNTPQFDWVKSRLTRRAKPVPPIFQPEVAADAIVWAADHPRREYFVGLPTVEAIVGDRVAAGLADRYLARHGYDAQQTSEPEDPQRLHNLWSPVDDSRDFGARGRFDASARSSSLELVVSKHHRAFAAAGLAIAAAALFYIRRAA